MQRARHQRPNLNAGNRLGFVLCAPQAFPYRTFMPAVGGTILRRGNCWTQRSSGTLTSPSKYADLRFQHRPMLLTLCCAACHTIPEPGPRCPFTSQPRPRSWAAPLCTAFPPRPVLCGSRKDAHKLDFCFSTCKADSKGQIPALKATKIL